MIVSVDVGTSEDRMSQQAIKQQARRTAREMAVKRRTEREGRERRIIGLAERVMVVIGERDQAVAETEKRAGAALRESIEGEGLSLGEAVEWCAETVTVREATRLRRLAREPQARDSDRPGDRDGPQGWDGAALRAAGSGGAGPVRRGDDAGLAAVAAAITDLAGLARLPREGRHGAGQRVLWWTGAVAGRSERERTDGGDHGRFRCVPGPGDRLAQVRVRGDERGGRARGRAAARTPVPHPLRQRIAPSHVVVSSAGQNRREWSVQRRSPFSTLADPRGPRRRARELRNLAREDPQLVADDPAGASARPR